MDRLAIIRAESDLFAHTLEDCDPAVRVPCCPEWDSRDLLWHLTGVHHFWAGVLSSGARTDSDAERLERSAPPRPGSLEDMLVARDAATEALIEQLERHGDDEALWSWFEADQSVGFTRRMQTYEATIHRVDAQMAAGVPVVPLATEVAAGAVDHAVQVMWFGWAPEGASYEPLSVVELVAPDVDRRWLVQLGHCTGTDEEGETYDFPRAIPADDGDPVAIVTAPVADLALWAWTRGDAVSIEGSEEGRAQLLEQTDFGIP